MILDTLRNADRYAAMHQSFPRVFEFLRTPAVRDLPPGRTDIDGDTLYAMASTGPGKTQAEARLEVHRRFIDVHYLIAGKENVGWRDLHRCQDAETAYDEERDFLLYSDDPALWLAVHPGALMIFFPEDAHAPLVSSGIVQKVVVKVRI